MMSERVLVLDGRTIEALACVRSLGRAGYWVAVAGKLRWPLASWSRYCRARFHYPKETLAGFAALRTWAHGNEVRVVLPLTEATSLLCNAERSEWEALGIIVGCAPDSVLVRDRKSTRLNSSHGYISYAVFCLKKKTGFVLTTLALPGIYI